VTEGIREFIFYFPQVYELKLLEEFVEKISPKPERYIA